MSNHTLTLPESQQSSIKKLIERPLIGEVCLLHAEAYKTNVAITSDKANKYPRKTAWHSTGKLGIPFNAHYIGYRVVHEGETRLEHDEDGHGRRFSYPVFKRTNSRVVWVFVESEKHGLTYVFPEDVERANGGQS